LRSAESGAAATRRLAALVPARAERISGWLGHYGAKHQAWRNQPVRARLRRAGVEQILRSAESGAAATRRLAALVPARAKHISSWLGHYGAKHQAWRNQPVLGHLPRPVDQRWTSGGTPRMWVSRMPSRVN